MKKERRTGGKTFFFPPRHAVSRPSQKRDLQEHDRGRWRTVVCVDLKSIREEYGRRDPEAVSVDGAPAARSRGAIWRGVERGTSRFELLGDMSSPIEAARRSAIWPSEIVDDSLWDSL